MEYQINQEQLGLKCTRRLTAGVNDIGDPEPVEKQLGADVVNRPNVGRHWN